MNITEISPGEDADSKASLFCPDCGRSAPLDNGWRIDRHSERTEIDCPRCETVLVSQPRFRSDCSEPLVA